MKTFKEFSMSEKVNWKEYDAPYGGRHGKKFDSWEEWQKVEKEREELEKSKPPKEQKK